MTNKQPEALRLAKEWKTKAQKEASHQNSAYDVYGMGNTPESVDPLGASMAAELRRQYARIAELEAQLATAQPAAQGMDAQLVAFIEKVRDFKAQAVRVGSSQGQIRWDIEYGHYGDEVSAKTLSAAITKALAAQAKQG